MTPYPETRESDERGGVGPYLAVISIALVIGVGIAVYLFAFRDEILAILTQLPT